jgi:hypothetical protein
MSDPFPIWPYVRIPMGMRLRLVADVMNATKAVKLPPNAPAMQRRRAWRMAMEKQKRRKLRLWRENVR